MANRFEDKGPMIKPNLKPTQPEPEPQPVRADDELTAILKKKPTGKVYANLYLDEEVVKTIDKIANSTRKSRSKVANTALRLYLKLDGE